MNDASVIIALIAGCLLGGVVVWLWVRGKIHQAADQAKGKFELQLAVSSERVADRDMEIAELRLESEQQKKQLVQLDAQLRDESTRRATGEERAKRIPQLEDQLACKDKQIIRLCWRRPHLENYNLLKWFEAFECANTLNYFRQTRNFAYP